MAEYNKKPEAKCELVTEKASDDVHRIRTAELAEAAERAEAYETEADIEDGTVLPIIKDGLERGRPNEGDGEITELDLEDYGPSDHGRNLV